MKKLKCTILVTLTGFFVVPIFTSCNVTSSLYTWHKYEDKAYKNSKKQTEESKENLEKEYKKILTVQTGIRKTVPPGLFAEYGFFLYNMGQKDKAIIYFQKEIESYPESEIFISRIKEKIEK